MICTVFATIFIDLVLGFKGFDGPGSYSQGISAVVGIITLFATWKFVWSNLKKKKTLTYSILANSDKTKWMDDKFQIRYIHETENKIIETPYLLMFKIKNICKVEVGKNDFSSPIMLELPQNVQIIGQPIIEGMRQNRALVRNVNHTLLEDGQKLEISFETLHPRNSFAITLILNGNPSGFDLNAYGKYRNVKFLKSEFNKTSWNLTLWFLCLVCSVGVASALFLFYFAENIGLLGVTMISVGLFSIVTYGVTQLYVEVAKHVNND